MAPPTETAPPPSPFRGAVAVDHGAHPRQKNGRRVRTSRGLGKEPETGHDEAPPAGKTHGHLSVPHIYGVASEKRKTRHEEDARTRDLAQQRTPAAAEAGGVYTCGLE